MFLLDLFDSRDVNRFMKEDFYVKRFFMHVWDEPGDQIDVATDMIINCFKWRREFGVRGNLRHETLAGETPTLGV